MTSQSSDYRSIGVTYFCFNSVGLLRQGCYSRCRCPPDRGLSREPSDKQAASESPPDAWPFPVLCVAIIL